MLDTKPSFERIALNRASFGARDRDVAAVTASGWKVWVDDQLDPPRGDDPQLAAYIAQQTMHISYPAPMASEMSMGMNATWKAVDEDRPLNYLNASIPELWNVPANTGRSLAYAEMTRIQQELIASLWIRNTHSRYQLREVLADFWMNHFNVGTQKSPYASAMVNAYERDVIRPNVLGSFRALLEAVASSPSMLMYLDNANSQADLPNENYARELLELHSMGGGAYLGKEASASAKVETINGVSAGFTDDDVLQVSRALSGWTLKRGQVSAENTVYPYSGEFVYNAAQHNPNAGRFLGVDLSGISGDMAQGRKVLDIVAAHPATAQFVCTKLCRRIFGDKPPQTVIDRAKTAWLTHADKPDQLKRVMQAILLDGPEIGTGPQVKVRRPYERVIAMLRAADAVVMPDPYFGLALDAVNDTACTWPAPDGRPDNNSFWLNTFTQITVWNFLRDIINQWSINLNALDQTPVAARKSVTLLVEYWVERMVGYPLSPEGMAALIEYAGGHTSALYNDSDLRRSVIAMIAGSPEFAVK